MSWQPPNNGMNASQLVNAGWTYFQGKSAELMQSVTAHLNDVTSSLLDAVPPTISFTMPPIEGARSSA